MKEQLVTPLIGIIVTALLSVWKTPGIREGVFSWIGKLPRVIQWLAPLTLSMLATAGEGFLNGKSGEDLFYFAMGSGAEAGVWAIATWHVAKRIYEFVKGSPATQALILLGALAAGGTQVGCSLEAARQARVNSQLRAGTYSAPAQTRPAQECKALDDVHVYTMYGTEVSLGVGTAAGVLAAADTSTKVENVAIGTGIGAAVVAAGLGYWSQKSGALWAEQCSQ